MRAQLLISLALTLGMGVAAFVGWQLARRRRFPVHCRLMATAALLNWVPILLVMIPSWLGLAAHRAWTLGGPTTLVPLAHGVLGGVSQLLITYTAVRMNWLKRLPPHNTRLLMRVALVFWLLSALGGIGVFLLWYV